MEPTKDRITPEQFYSESKWPEMKDKFDKSAFLFHYYDLCQFANDYAQQELQAYRDMIKELLPIAEKMRWALEDHIEPHEEDFIRFIEAINKAKTIKNKT